jgi:predicted dienelactone hydrolase
MVRAFYRSAIIPDAAAPFDRVTLKIYYPAAPGDSAEERNSGVVPADTSDAPFPVVIFLPGINLGAEGCAWLARDLAEIGYAVVTFSHVGEEMPGYVSLTPGLVLPALGPDRYGSEPSCYTLEPIIQELHRLNDSSVLQGLLDLGHIILAGHSAGGTAALLNAQPDWFPGVCGVISYAAHSGASVALGWPAETIMPLPAAVPTLMLGGNRDGVIASSAHRYGRDTDDPVHTLLRTFEDGIEHPAGDCYLFILEEANHFSFAHGHDGTTGREFLDWECDSDPDDIRQRIKQLILDFLAAVVRDDNEARSRLQQALKSSDISVARFKTA